MTDAHGVLADAPAEQWPRDLSEAEMDELATALNEHDAGSIGFHGLVDRVLAVVRRTAGVRACGSNECVAGQRDGVLCANGECDRENGVRPNGVATRHPRCGYPYCACVGECFAASQPGVTAGVATDGGADADH